MLRREWRWGHAAVRVDYGMGRVRTTFPDGAWVDGGPRGDVEERVTAARLGYNGDVARLHLEHDSLHSLVMARLGFPWSPTLWAAAHPGDPAHPPLWRQWAEEDLILRVQAALNAPAAAARAGDGLPFPGGATLLDIRAEALHLLRGGG